MKKELFKIESDISSYPIYVVAVDFDDAIQKYNEQYSNNWPSCEKKMSSIKKITNECGSELIY